MNPKSIVSASLLVAASNVPVLAQGSQTFRCELQQVSTGGLEGHCTGLEMAGSRKTAVVALESGPDDPGPWRGDLIVDRGRLAFEMAEEAFGAGSRLVVRENVINWFLGYVWTTRADGTVIFVFNMLDEASPSQRDIAILNRTASRFETLERWDRGDDRNCENDPPGTRSLFCLLFDVVSEEMSRYHHRQPGLQLLRSMIRDRWEDRVESHALRDFNNHPATTRDDVLTLLGNAVECVRAQWEFEHWADPIRGL